MAQMDDRLAGLLPLVHQLERFCRLHEQGQSGAAAGSMLDCVRRCWPDIPTMNIYNDASVGGANEPTRTADEIALRIIASVGEMAEYLGELLDPERELAWSRANLICTLEQYEKASGGQSGRGKRH